MRTRAIDRPLRDVLDELASPPPGPASGVAVAISLAMAGSIVAMIGEASRATWDYAGGVAVQANELRERANLLIDEEAEVFAAALKALRAPDANVDLGEVLRAAAVPPVRLAELAADIAQLGSLAARFGDPDLRADALVAVMMATAAARAAAHLVEINLMMTLRDPLVLRAQAAARAAAVTAGDALEPAGAR